MSVVINDFIAEIGVDSDIDQDLRDNIYPLLAPDEVVNCIVYTLSDGIRESFYRDSQGLKTNTVALNIYHTNYDTLVSTREQLENDYNGFSGILNSNSIVSRIQMNDVFFTVEPGNNKLFRCTTEFDLIT